MYDFVFVVLCYRNTADLSLFLKSLHRVKGSYKVILVESYFDDQISKEFHTIAEKNNCIFLTVPNNGYGAGNNRGIEYAKTHYDFRFLVISNPDIEIKKLNINDLNPFGRKIIGPNIYTLSGKRQNPHHQYILNSLIMFLMYVGMKREQKWILFLGIVINKIFRELNYFYMKVKHKKQQKVIALHGAFLIFSMFTLNQLGAIFDEKMFLFAEEDQLGYLAKDKNIDMIYDLQIEVLHHEDGSMKFADLNFNQISRKSYLYCYEKWNKISSLEKK